MGRKYGTSIVLIVTVGSIMILVSIPRSALNVRVLFTKMILPHTLMKKENN